MSGDCLFCKIAAKEIPTEIIYENDSVAAFRDINPAAPTHILVIPKKHIESIASLQDKDADIVGDIMLAIRDLAQNEGLGEGFRVIANTGAQAGQTVPHLHFHLLGGRELAWPPG